MKYALALTFLAGLLTFGVPQAQAIEAYSEADQQTFLDWCTGEKEAQESVCSCALKRLANTVPAATLTQYLDSLSKDEDTAYTSMLKSGAIMTTTVVLGALSTCGN